MNFNTPDGKVTLEGTLVTVAGDIVGSQLIGGFKGSCIALQPCRHCMVFYNEMKTKVQTVKRATHRASLDLFSNGNETQIPFG